MPKQTKLKIAKGLSLDLDAVTKTYAILAQRRKGKTYTANVIAEEMVKVGIPWVALDPTGAWWGLRAGKDGSSKGGLPVYVFGGQHGDLPLEETAGKVIADLVVDQPGHYILDVSEFASKAAQRRFAQDFGDRLFHRKAQNRDVLHVFIDEADVFVPQKIPKGHEKMVGIYEEIVRRGGIRGLGSTMISQRSAIVNKNVLEQLDALIVLRVTGPRDQKAILEYVEAEGDEEEVQELKATIKRLKLGEAWFWEPGADPAIFKKVQIRERRTFNSSATPSAMTKSAKAVKMKSIDLDALRGEIEATIEKAAEEDPEQLRKRIRNLEREIERLTNEVLELEQTKPKEIQTFVPVLDEETIRLIKDYRPQLEHLNKSLHEALSITVERLAKMPAPGARREGKVRGFNNGKSDESPTGRRKRGLEPIKKVKRNRSSNPGAEASEVDAIDADHDVKLGKAERALLSVLFQYEGAREKKNLATLAGYTASGGSFRNALSKLRTNGLVEGDGIVTLTAAGERRTEEMGVEPLPEGEELFSYWMSKLGKAEREILTVLYEHRGGVLTKEEIADLTESQYEATGGSFRNALSALRSRDLIEGKEEMGVTEALCI